MAKKKIDNRSEPKKSWVDGKPFVSNGWIDGSYFEIKKQPSARSVEYVNEVFADIAYTKTVEKENTVC